MKLFIATLLIGLAASCTHVEVEMPGVLDLRSDARELDVDARTTPAMKAQAREGLSAWFGGDGVVAGKQGDVVVDARMWWFASIARVGDGDVHAGLQSVLPKDDATTPLALRNVVLAEEITVGEAFAYWCGLPIPCVDVAVVAFMPTRTLRASGTRVVVKPLQPAAPVEEATP